MNFKPLRKSQKLSPFFRAAISGDLSSFKSLIKNRFSDPRELEFVRRSKLRFTDRSTSSNSNFVTNLIRIYEKYWINALLRRNGLTKCENDLFKATSDLLRAEGLRITTKDKARIEKRIERHLLEQYGLQSLFGVVRPIRELEIWRKSRRRVFHITIPEAKVKVPVHFISGFQARGWLAFATQSVYCVGGWAKTDRLVCNGSIYNQNSETFKISYLAHEAQHFQDYKDYPKLVQHDLEYRAKLTELALAKRTKNQLLKKLSDLAKFGKQSPHSHANYFVIKDLKKQLQISRSVTDIDWKTVSSTEINGVAKQALELHSEKLNGIGAKKTTGVIHCRNR
jgi:hypothetical protein